MPSLATWFTPMLSVISRAKGRTATAASAYRACIKVTDERLSEVHDYRKKKGHVETMLFGADSISNLWNKAEKSENRKNSTVARELILPLAHEWNDTQRRSFSEAISLYLREKYGVAVQASIHRPTQGLNHHVHVLFTTRTVDGAMNFGKKTRILDDCKTGEVENLREAVCKIMNEHAQMNGSDWYVYAGKFSDINVDHTPTKHINTWDTNESKYEKLIFNRELMTTSSQIEALKAELDKAEANETIKLVHKVKAKVNLPTVHQPTLISKEVDLTKYENGIAKSQTYQAKQELAETNAIAKNSIAELSQSSPSTILNRAFELQKNSDEITEMLAKKRKIEETMDKLTNIMMQHESLQRPRWISKLLKLASPLIEKFGIPTEIQRLEKITKCRTNLETCKRGVAKIDGDINKPERKEMLKQWQNNPVFKKAIILNRDTTPDERMARNMILERSLNNAPLKENANSNEVINYLPDTHSFDCISF